MIGCSPLGGSLPIRILKQLTAIHPTQSFPSVTRKDRFGSKGEILAASKYFPLFFQQQTFEEPLDARHLVDRAIPTVTWSHGCLRARKIWIDDALGGAA